jgi:hypothetical protein
MIMTVDQSVECMNGKGNQSTAVVLLCPSQIPRDLIWTRTQVAAVGNRLITEFHVSPLLCKQLKLSSLQCLEDGSLRKRQVREIPQHVTSCADAHCDPSPVILFQQTVNIRNT